MDRRSVAAGGSVLAAALWVLMRSGTGVLPGLEGPLEAASRWPQRPVDPLAGFLADSPLGILAFRALHLTDARGLLWLHAFAVVLAITAFALLAAWWSGPGLRSRAARLALLAPLSAILLAWVGAYDPFTILAWALALWGWTLGRRWTAIVLAIPLSFQHFEHAILGLAALCCIWAFLRDRLPDRLRGAPLWLLPGILIGKLLLLAVFLLSGVELSSRGHWLGPFFREWFASGANVLPLLVWSLFAGAWALVAWTAFLPRPRQSHWWLATAIAIGLVATVLSGDRPRVFVLVLAPSVLIMVVAFVRTAREHVVASRTVEAIMWIAPPVILWGKVVVNANVIDLAVIAAQQLGLTG